MLSLHKISNRLVTRPLNFVNMQLRQEFDQKNFYFKNRRHTEAEGGISLFFTILSPVGLDYNLLEGLCQTSLQYIYPNLFVQSSDRDKFYFLYVCVYFFP